MQTKIQKPHFLILFGLLFSFPAFSQFNVYSSGNVAIGAITPVSPLHVYGSLPNWWPITTSEVTNQYGINLSLLWNQGNGNIAENIYAVGDGWMMVKKGIWNGSDSTLKTNVSTITGPISKIQSLRGVNFKWKPDTAALHYDSAYVPDSTVHFGFIAQAVMRAFPGQHIAQRMHDSICAVNYNEVTPILVEAVKAQQSEITLGEDSLKTSITHLKDSLGSQIVTLKTSLQTSKDSIALLQTEENNTASRLEFVNDSNRAVINVLQAQTTLLQTQESNTAARVVTVTDSMGAIISPLQSQLTTANFEILELQFQMLNIENSLTQIRDSLLTTFNCNCNGNGGGYGGPPAAPATDGSLGQNQPNPYNGQTTIKYSLVGSISSATINVYNSQGILELTFNLPAQAGSGSITVSANSLSPGTYIYNLVVNNTQVDSKEMVITN